MCWRRQNSLFGTLKASWVWLEGEGVLPWCTKHGPSEKSMKCNACGVGDGFQSWAPHLVAEWLRRVIVSLFSKEYWLQHDRCCVKHEDWTQVWLMWPLPWKDSGWGGSSYIKKIELTLKEQCRVTLKSWTQSGSNPSFPALNGTFLGSYLRSFQCPFVWNRNRNTSLYRVWQVGCKAVSTIPAVPYTLKNASCH